MYGTCIVFVSLYWICMYNVHVCVVDGTSSKQIDKPNDSPGISRKLAIHVSPTCTTP